MGSGTTAIACMNIKRKFIGFEIDKKRFDSIETRVNTNITFVEQEE